MCDVVDRASEPREYLTKSNYAVSLALIIQFSQIKFHIAWYWH